MSKSDTSQLNTTAIVVTWNNEKIIEECLKSLIAQNKPLLEIIVVDNNSADETAELVAKKFPGVTLLRQSENTGFAKGNNIGIRRAFANPQCKHIVLLNADARLRENWLEHVQTFQSSHPKGAGFQGLTLNYFDKSRVDSLGIVINRNGQPLQQGFETKKQKEYTPMEVFGVNAAAALYTREFLEKQPFSDYFDEDLFMYYEDVDLSARALVMGFENYLVPEAVAYHMGSASKRKKMAEKLMLRNSGLVLIKNFPAKILRMMFRGYIKAELRRIFAHLKHKEFALFWASLVGKLQGFLLIPRFIKKRKSLQKLQNVDEKKLWDLM